MKSGKDQPELLTRREAILRVSAMLGGVALVGQTAMLAGTRRSEAQAREALFTDADIALLDEIAETILPETGTPGAKAAAVGPFMAMMVADVYFDRDQGVFTAGLKAVDDRCQSENGAGFMTVSPAERLALLEELDVEQHEYMNSDEERDSAHFFRMMKELALLGYFTSEIGYTQAMRYTETPGRFEPCTDYEPGEKSWARHA